MSFITLKPDLGRPVAYIEKSNGDRTPVYVIDEFDEKHAKRVQKYLEDKPKIFLSENSRLKTLEKSIQHLHSDVRKRIDLPTDQKMTPIPRLDTRAAIYIGAPSGAGKSYLIGEILRNYRKLDEEMPFFLFSRKPEDEALDSIPGLSRIKIDEDMLENPIQLEELKNSFCIFDDIDSLERSLYNAVASLRDMLLECGRSSNCNVICVSHNLTNSTKTRFPIMECDQTVFFPKSCDSYHIKSYLQKYCGLNAKQIQEIFNIPSRWCMISKSSPMYILHQKGIYLLKD